MSLKSPFFLRSTIKYNQYAQRILLLMFGWNYSSSDVFKNDLSEHYLSIITVRNICL